MRTIATLLCTLACLVAMAASNSLSMVSYTPGKAPSEAMIELKNNTQDTVYNVSLVVHYRADEPCDTVDKRVVRPYMPGDTVTVFAPIHHCVDTVVGCNPTVEMLGYNAVDDNGEIIKDKGPIGFNLMPVILGTLGLIAVLLLLALVLLIVVMVVAHKRHRSVLLWALASLVITPFLALIILLMLKPRHREDDSSYIVK